MAFKEVNNSRVLSNPISLSVKEASGLNLDIEVTCAVEIMWMISSKADFSSRFGYDEAVFMNQLTTDVNSALLMAFLKVAQNEVSYAQLKESGTEIATELVNQMTDPWHFTNGVGIISVTVSDIKASDSDEMMLNSFATPMTPDMMAQSLLAGVMGQIQADGGWTCTCGCISKGKFCPSCGTKRP